MTARVVAGVFRPVDRVAGALADRVGEPVTGTLVLAASAGSDPLYEVRFADGRWVLARGSEIAAA